MTTVLLVVAEHLVVKVYRLRNHNKAVAVQAGTLEMAGRGLAIVQAVQELVAQAVAVMG
jgi:hypothetical protein